MVSEVSFLLGLSETLSSLYCLLVVLVAKAVVMVVVVVLVGVSCGGSNESSQFQEFPEAVLSCLSLVLKSFLAGWTLSVS